MGSNRYLLEMIKKRGSNNMKKPNIVFVFADDQRYNTIHALGNNDIKTPHLDELVGEGEAFTQAHIMGATCGAVCMPSRAMMLTGRELNSLYGAGLRNGSIIPEYHKTFPQVFMENGYHTHIIGKWHQDRLSLNRSFCSGDRIFGFANGWYETYGGHFNIPLHDFDVTGEYGMDDAYILNAAGEKEEVKSAVCGMHSNDIFRDAAIDFINERNDREPFLLYVSLVAPHDPRQTSDYYEDMYSSETVELPPNYMPMHPFDNGDLYGRDERLEWWPRRKRAVKKHIADYYSMITHIDDTVGAIIKSLKQKNIYDDTIFIFAADNGLAVGQHGLMGKQNLYEHSIRVPLIIKGNNFKKGKRNNDFCYLLDLFPTLCECCGIKMPDTVEGNSIINDDKRQSLNFQYLNCQKAYKDREYKIIRYDVNGTVRYQLFDMKNDENELNDLSKEDEFKHILEQYKKALETV